MGKLKDNSLNKLPSVIFDTNKFAVYEHRMSKQTFRKLPIYDVENLGRKVPRDFKSVYAGNQTYLIAGGQEKTKQDNKKSKASQKAFIFKQGNLQEVLPMFTARQFFSMSSTAALSSPVGELAEHKVYVVGGFDPERGEALTQCEIFDLNL